MTSDGGRRVVMVVEDEPLICELVAEHLQRAGFQVLTHTSNFEGLLTAEPWEDVDVAVVDLMLPGIATGLAILEYLADVHPTVRRVLFTAIGDLNIVDPRLYDALVTKPGNPSQLVEAVRG